MLATPYPRPTTTPTPQRDGENATLLGASSGAALNKANGNDGGGMLTGLVVGAGLAAAVGIAATGYALARRARRRVYMPTRQSSIVKIDRTLPSLAAVVASSPPAAHMDASTADIVLVEVGVEVDTSPPCSSPKHDTKWSAPPPEADSGTQRVLFLTPSKVEVIEHVADVQG
jgi:hypothetical protein